ncbi:MAG: hypothetical protein PHH60_05190 [Candidatus Margulisbacteria bacterium]|nr:hypothetical protein [Candidatus Margulisiibacteriota bacterium]
MKKLLVVLCLISCLSSLVIAATDEQQIGIPIGLPSPSYGYAGTTIPSVAVTFLSGMNLQAYTIKSVGFYKIDLNQGPIPEPLIKYGAYSVTAANQLTLTNVAIDAKIDTGLRLILIVLNDGKYDQSYFSYFTVNSPDWIIQRKDAWANPLAVFIDICTPDEEHFMAVGSSLLSPNNVFYTSDRGRTIKESSITGDIDFIPLSVTAKDINTYYVAGISISLRNLIQLVVQLLSGQGGLNRGGAGVGDVLQGSIYKTINGGVTWTKVTMPTTDQENVIVAQGSTTPGLPSKAVYIYPKIVAKGNGVWAAAIEINSLMSGGTLPQDQFTTQGTVIVTPDVPVETSSTAQIFYSLDDGNSWTGKTIDSQALIFNLAVTQHASGNYEVYALAFPTEIAQQLAYLLQSIMGGNTISAQTVSIQSTYIGRTKPALLYKSIDSGKNFFATGKETTNSLLEKGIILFDIAAVEKDVFVSGINVGSAIRIGVSKTKPEEEQGGVPLGLIMRSSNGGDTWTDISPKAKDQLTIIYLDVDAKKDIRSGKTLVMAVSPLASFRSSDGGASWNTPNGDFIDLGTIRAAINDPYNIWAIGGISGVSGLLDLITQAGGSGLINAFGDNDIIIVPGEPEKLPTASLPKISGRFIAKLVVNPNPITLTSLVQGQTGDTTVACAIPNLQNGSSFDTNNADITYNYNKVSGLSSANATVNLSVGAKAKLGDNLMTWKNIDGGTGYGYLEIKSPTVIPVGTPSLNDVNPKNVRGPRAQFASGNKQTVTVSGQNLNLAQRFILRRGSTEIQVIDYTVGPDFKTAKLNVPITAENIGPGWQVILFDNNGNQQIAAGTVDFEITGELWFFPTQVKKPAGVTHFAANAQPRIAYALPEDKTIELFVYNATNPSQVVYHRRFAAGQPGGKAGYNDNIWPDLIADGGNPLPNGAYVVLGFEIDASGARRELGRTNFVVVESK